MAFDSYQINAIEDNSKSLIITAGAGSGKTTTMIGRTLRAINHPTIMKQLSNKIDIEKYKPEQIRVVSFTNVAADTFKEKLGYISNGAADNVNVSTLDKFAIQIIQHIFPNAKCDLDEYDIAKVLYEDLNDITNLQYLFPTFASYFELIDKANQKFSNAQTKRQKRDLYDRFVDEYVEYILKTKKPKDTFSIPLQSVYKLAVTTMIKYDFIPDIKLLIVDELQDTSDAQFILLNFLQSQLNDMKFIGIGDVSQSMYRWNNAKPQRVSQYIDEYEAKLITLPNNYRSHPDIIDLANNLLSNNIDNIAGIQLNAKSKIDFNSDIENKVEYMNGVESIEQKVNNLLSSGVKPNDIAIIARSGSVLTKIEENQTNYTIKYNNKQNQRTKRINYLSFVSRRLSYFLTLLEEKNESLMEIATFLMKQKLTDYIYNNIDMYSTLKREKTSQYYMKLTKELTKHKTRLSNQLQKILYQAPTSTLKENEITLSTVHGVKGDEFDYVIYVPTKKAIDKTLNIDPNLNKEEKELLWGNYAELQNIDYVAVTRAREQITIVGYDQNFDSMKRKIEDCKTNDKPYNKDVAALLSHYTLEKD